MMLQKIMYDIVLGVSGCRMYETLRELESSQYRCPESTSDALERGLAAIVNHARSNCDFYTDYPSLGPMGSRAEFEELPLLSKQQLAHQAASLISRRRSFPSFKKTTGGSTGEPVTVIKDAKAFGAELAAAWRGLSWAGIEVGMKQARFWGTPASKFGAAKARFIDYLGNRVRVSAFDYGGKAMADAVPMLNRFRPEYFYGYVSVLKEFAVFVRSSNSTLTFRPKAIVTTAEVLDGPTRQLIEETFDTKIFQEYGCGEVGTIAHECEHGSLHVNSENLYLEEGELLPGSDNLKELYVTDLKNKAMPLIRYRIGDLGELATNPCACGRVLPILKTIRGRAYDILVNPQGRKFHPEFFIYIFEDAKNLGMKCPGFQVEQTDFDSFHVRLLEPVTDHQRLSAYVLSRLKRDFSPSAHVDFSVVPELERERSGKMRVVKSSVQ